VEPRYYGGHSSGRDFFEAAAIGSLAAAIGSIAAEAGFDPGPEDGGQAVTVWGSGPHPAQDFPVVFLQCKGVP